MRIPSQFNEDSLYRRGRRSSQSIQSYRRLLRMVLGLALVVVVMRQASKPGMYRVFFGGGPAEPVLQAENGGSALLTEGEGVGIYPPVVVDAQDRKIAKSLVADLARSDQNLWMVALTRWQQGKSVSEFPSTAESVTEQIESLESIESERRIEWLGMLQALSDRAALGDAESAEDPVPKKSDQAMVAAFLAALDDAADARVIDGSVWRSGDFDAFYRYLDQSSGFSPAGLATTGVLPLLQQPDVFRGQLLRVQGTVARAEEMEAAENVFGIESYWQLWLRPADGADRPIMVIVPEVGEAVAAVSQAGIEQEGPPVMVAGRFLKRLAYTSSMGADLAPVVVGRLVASQPKTAAVIPEEEDGSSVGGRLLMTVAVALLVGVGLAVIGVWRTAVAARDGRRLRTAYRENPDFADLELPQPEQLLSQSESRSPDAESRSPDGENGNAIQFPPSTDAS